MCEQVNINVSETNETINIVSSEIQEVIDINVFESTEDVTLNITEQLIQVNVNKVTAAEQIQSDWNQTDNEALDFIKNKPTIPTNTSDLINDGEDGVNPFITANDIPPVTGFVPYTGATANVDLGEFEIKAGQVTLDTTPTGTAVVATTRWNDTIGSTETTLKGGSVVLKNGVDLVARVVNKVTPNTTLTKAAYQAVRISGAQGQRLAVAYAQANNDNNSADTIGIVCETIATNQEGFILTVGQLEEINTTGSLQGETWADGDVLYLSPTTAGRLTNIKPTGATGHIVVMGYVEYAHAIHGKIYVKIMNGWELDELHNVYINAPANNEGLFYDSADSLWKNETIASALGYTPVTNARTISTTAPLSGGGDLTANRTLSITQASTSTDGYLSSTNWNTFNNKFTLPALTSGSVLFSNGTTIAQDNANLFWDDTNNRLGINKNTPNVTLDVVGNEYRFASNSGAINFYAFPAVNQHFNFINSRQDSDYLFKLNVNGAANTNVLILKGLTGNVLINTATDAGFKLDVNGTARVSGTTTITPAALTGTAATSALDISQTWNTTGTPTAIKLNITNTASNASSNLIDLQVGGLSRFKVRQDGALTTAEAISGNSLSISTSTINYSYSHFLSNRATTATSGLTNIFTSFNSFSPTSGTATFIGTNISPTINQTGGANGITRGLFINPTLTAAADFRAIEVANGITILGASTTSKSCLGLPEGSVPTSPTVGDVWNSSATNTLQYSQSSLNTSISGTVFTGTANANTNNTSTETSITPTGIGTLTLPANFLTAGKTVRLRVAGTYTTDAVAPTLVLKFKFGSTSIIATSATTLASAANGYWEGNFIVTCRTTGASGTFASFGAIDLSSAEGTEDKTVKLTASPTIDTTTTQAITVTAQWGAADTDNSITTTILTVETLN